MMKAARMIGKKMAMRSQVMRQPMASRGYLIGLPQVQFHVDVVSLDALRRPVDVVPLGNLTVVAENFHRLGVEDGGAAHAAAGAARGTRQFYDPLARVALMHIEHVVRRSFIPLVAV